MAADRAHRMLYRQIPAASGCKPGCFDCCGPVPWSAAELARVADEVPPTAEWISVNGTSAMQNALTGLCPFASAAGCQVYDRRPFMCRLFASVEDTRLVCPHGCKSAKPLTSIQATRLTDAYRKEPRHG